MDDDPRQRTRADHYRETARLIRKRAAKLRTNEARESLNLVARDYERLANYVDALWESPMTREPQSPSERQEASIPSVKDGGLLDR